MVAVAKKESDPTIPVTHLRLSQEIIGLANRLAPMESRELGLELSQRDLLKIAIKIGLDVLAQKHGVEGHTKKR